MDPRSLELYSHLARTLHFGKTSRECAVSPSALSRTIQRIEAELGEKLFARDRRSVELTPAGAAFEAYASETLARYEALKRNFDEGGRLSGTLAIFASVTACQSFLPSVLATFRRSYPEIHIRLETGYAADAFGMLARGAVDVSVAALPPRAPPGLVTRVLLVTPIVLVAPAIECEASRLLQERVIPWERVPIVLPAQGLLRASAERFFKKRGVRPLVYGEVPGNEAILSLVSLGCGVGVVPRIVMEQSPLRAAVRPLDAELGELRVGVCTERRKLKTAVVKAFWESVDATAR
jgi:LysR family positive regulator for ilvC